MKVIGPVYYHFRFPCMRVIETSLDRDLSLFCRYLRQQRVAHRVYEERGAQVLELSDPAQADAVRADYRAWEAGSLIIEALPQPPRSSRWTRPLARYPGLTVLIAVTLAVFPFSWPLAEGRLTAVAAWLAIVDLRLPATAVPSWRELIAELQIWRWFTPMLLHFSVLHLAFNCAVTIELGRRVERALGALGLWLLVLALAGISNLVQYAFGGGPLFGGLSGVAYGMLGFILVMNWLQPRVVAWQFPRGIAAGLLVFLLLFTTGITEPFGLLVANAAHWGGLVTGAALGLAASRLKWGAG